MSLFLKLCAGVILSAGLLACQQSTLESSNDIDTLNTPESAHIKVNNCNNELILDAYKQQRSDLQVKGCGKIVKVLPDDNKGSRHQRLIVQLFDVTPNQTILIAHNIDLAPKANSAKEGKKISFYGEYEYTNQGGVVHWTHLDPAGRHQAGWLEIEGEKYQ